MKNLYFIPAFLLFLTVLNIKGYAQNPDNPKKSPCFTCESLRQLDLPDVKISETAITKENVPFCRMLGTIGKEIDFELLLPTE